jgi:enoyl-CoA hydratase/carnithine racemase
VTLRLEKQGHIGHLIIDRPEKRNAFNQRMWELLPELLGTAMADKEIRVLTVHASKPQSAFCAGADISEFANGGKDPVWRQQNQAAISRAQSDLARASKPIIAIIDGDCVGGGCGIAMACDIRISGPDARYGITPAKLGLVYSLHDTKLLVDLVGPSQAKRMLFTGQLLTAHEALRVGLVTILADNPYADAAVMAENIAETSPHSLRASKAIVRRILDGQADDDAHTSALFGDAFDSDDFIEGVNAFLNKRKPNFP